MQTYGEISSGNWRFLLVRTFSSLRYLGNVENCWILSTGLRQAFYEWKPNQMLVLIYSYGYNQSGKSRRDVKSSSCIEGDSFRSKCGDLFYLCVCVWTDWEVKKSAWPTPFMAFSHQPVPSFSASIRPSFFLSFFNSTSSCATSVEMRSFCTPPEGIDWTGEFRGHYWFTHLLGSVLDLKNYYRGVNRSMFLFLK